MKKITLALFCMLLVVNTLITPVNAHNANNAVVYAVIFYSPNCGHCYYVITEVLPPLFKKYGSQLQMIGIDASQPDGYTLFLSALQKFNLEHAGVPFLVVGDTYLIGDVDIPQKFPGMIEQYLSQGGVDWPAIPGLTEVLVAMQSTSEAQPSAMPIQKTPMPVAATMTQSVLIPDLTPTATPVSLILIDKGETSIAGRFGQDPVGNSLSIVVLIGMLVSVLWGWWAFRVKPGHQMTELIRWAFPALCLAGLFVAGYLSYVEITQSTAVCGPVGDCNKVQQSAYARLFGILPIGVLGMAGYTMILIAWATSQFAKGKTIDYSILAILAMTSLGTLFSIYLTFLEPFVIGAICAWCLTSSILMTVLMLFSLSPGKLAAQHIFQSRNRNQSLIKLQR